MDNPVPRRIKTQIIAIYDDDKSEKLTLELELPDVKSENITLIRHENSVYLKAFSKKDE